MNGPGPIVPDRDTERLITGGTRLQRIMNLPDSEKGSVRSAVVDVLPSGIELGGQLPATIRIEDVAGTIPGRQSSASVAVQVLWQAVRHDAGIFAGRDPLDDTSLLLHPAHPGDTLLVPPGMPFAPGAGSIVAIASVGTLTATNEDATAGALTLPPTHGLHLFRGYNRRTICLAAPGLMLERWKLTSPLALDIAPGRPLYLLNLVQSVALTWARGIRRLGPLEAITLPDALRQVTVVPDGLGYVLIVSDPDLVHAVIPSLQAAGYPRSELHAIGIPSHLT